MTKKTFSKYKLVIDEWFVNGFNGTKAYQKYYPKVSEDTAAVKFSEMVRIGKVETYRKSKENDAQEVLRTSHETLLQELENWAYSDITETLMLSPDQIKALPAEVRRLITKYETNTKSYMANDQLTTDTTVKLWFVSKEKAMEMIHKHTGFYGLDNSQKIPENAEVHVSYNGKKIDLST